MFVYDTNSVSEKGSFFDPSKVDATKQYLVHYDNLLTLDFIFQNTDKRDEKVQCEKEMEIARRRMRFWSKMPTYVDSDALSGMIELKKKWGK